MKEKDVVAFLFFYLPLACVLLGFADAFLHQGASLIDIIVIVGGLLVAIGYWVYDRFMS